MAEVVLEVLNASKNPSKAAGIPHQFRTRMLGIGALAYLHVRHIPREI